MKKTILRVFGALGVLLLVSIVAIYFSLNSVVKKGVETMGPRITKVDTKLGGVSLMPINGSGQINALQFGNPPHYRSAYAIRVGEAKLDLKLTSLLGDKIIIQELIIDRPEITLEGTLQGKNNLTEILKNIEEYVAAEKKDPATATAAPKLQINQLKIIGAKAHLSLDLMQGRTIPVSVGDIQLQNLGTGPDGITVGELAILISKLLIQKVTEVGAETVRNLGKEVSGAVQDLKQGGVEGATKAAERVRDLLPKRR